MESKSAKLTGVRITWDGDNLPGFYYIFWIFENSELISALHEWTQYFQHEEWSIEFATSCKLTPAQAMAKNRDNNYVINTQVDPADLNTDGLDAFAIIQFLVDHREVTL